MPIAAENKGVYNCLADRFSLNQSTLLSKKLYNDHRKNFNGISFIHIFTVMCQLLILRIMHNLQLIMQRMRMCTTVQG